LKRKQKTNIIILQIVNKTKTDCLAILGAAPQSGRLQFG
jgi:hypothetical protein